jgi:hypothetical protein
VDPQWVQVVIQAGALGILGYHLIVGLPLLLRDLNASWGQIMEKTLAEQRAERTEATKRFEHQVDAIREITKSLPLMCRVAQPGTLGPRLPG